MSTPTLEKAAAVIEKLERDGYRFLDYVSGYDESKLISYIAAAIREAENETLERAAAEVEEQDEITGVEFKVNGKPIVGDDGCSDFVSIDRLNAAIVKKAAAIRSLKSKD